MFLEHPETAGVRSGQVQDWCDDSHPTVPAVLCSHLRTGGCAHKLLPGWRQLLGTGHWRTAESLSDSQAALPAQSPLHHKPWKPNWYDNLQVCWGKRFLFVSASIEPRLCFWKEMFFMVPLEFTGVVIVRTNGNKTNPRDSAQACTCIQSPWLLWLFYKFDQCYQCFPPAKYQVSPTHFVKVQVLIRK